MLKVPRLQPGDQVAVVAPSGPLDPVLYAAGAAVLRDWGLVLDEGADLFARHGYLAGTDEHRRTQLARALAGAEARVLWFARGGYGLLRTLEQLPLDAPLGPPKLLIGFSDLTPLLNLVAERFGWVALHGPTVASLGGLTPDCRAFLRELLFAAATDLELPAREVLVPGRARGPLCGGNLSLLAHSLGTTFAVDPTDRVLLIEEVGEVPYRVDRLLTQLRLARVFDRVAGVVVGHLSGPEGAATEAALQEVVRDRLADLGVPVLLGLPVGHRPEHFAVPIGAEVELDGAAGRLRLVDPIVSG